MTIAESQTFDFVIVGAGQAGCAAALAAVARGRSVAIVESRPSGPGGADVHETCLPAAVCRETANLLHAIRRAGECAVTVPEPAEADHAGLARRRLARSTAAAAGLAQQLQAAGVAVFSGRGYLAGGGTVAVLDRDTGDDIASVHGRHIILATGSVPATPAWFQPDGRQLLTLPQVWSLRRWPKTALILGSGPDACEAASFLLTVGTTVYMAFSGSSLLPAAGDDMTRHLAAAFQREGISIAAQSVAAGCEVNGGRCVTTLSTADGEETISSEVVIWASPNRAATDNLGLRKLGIVTDDTTGAIETDPAGITGCLNVYAVGACVNPDCTAPEARWRAERLVERLTGKTPAPPPAGGFPRLLATIPPVAWTGLTPAEARLACPAAVAATMATAADPSQPGCTTGFICLVGDPETGEILGAQTAGPDAAVLVAAVALARQFEYSLNDLAGLVASEPVLTGPLAAAARAWMAAASEHSPAQRE